MYACCDSFPLIYSCTCHLLIFIPGPILPEPPAPLPQDLALWMDASANGVLLVSLGTLAEVVLTDATVNMLAAVFSSLPVSVLWKLQRNAPSKLESNVKVVKWFPQNDLLAHPNLRAFFTHGGMNSVQASFSLIRTSSKTE